MNGTQLLVTVAVVLGALVGYHALFAPAEAPQAGVADTSPTSGGGAPALGGGSGLERTVADLARRLEALEQRGARGGASTRPPPGELSAFRALLAEARRAETEERQSQQLRNTVKRHAKDAAEAEIDGAVGVLERYYAGVREIYQGLGVEVDAQTRRDLQLKVDALQAQAETELQALLGDEIARQLRTTLPGGTRGGIGEVPPPR